MSCKQHGIGQRENLGVAFTSYRVVLETGCEVTHRKLREAGTSRRFEGKP